MQKNHPIRLAWLVGLSFFLLAGCYKRIDKLPDESSLCSVRWITIPALHSTTIGPTDTLRFSYDLYGNPVTISRLEIGTELYDYIFWYDPEHRLTDVIGTSSLQATTGSGYGTWDKLYYTKDRITLDTLFSFGIINGTRPESDISPDSLPFIRRISSYEYDSKGRISRVKDILPGRYVLINIYVYDRNGNLSKIELVSNTPHSDTTFILASGYDNKVNINRTNSIWQFLDRDYSENNGFTADKYNKAGLPTAISNINRQSPLPEPFGFLNIWTPLTIQYDCQLPGVGEGQVP